MGQRDLAGAGIGSAAGHTHGGDAVVGGAEGAAGDEGVAGIGQPQHRMDLSDLQGLLPGQAGEDGGQALGQHGFAGARRPHH